MHSPTGYDTEKDCKKGTDVNLYKYIFFPFLLSCIPLLASTSSNTDAIIEDIVTKDLQIDLKDPTFKDGALETSKGGVVSSEELRIQAMNVRYTKKQLEDGTSIVQLHAEDSLLIEFKDRIFIGKSIDYDFITKTGVIIDGRTAIEPWFVGGDKIDLLANGSYKIHNGFFTTSENAEPEWKISFDNTTLTKNNDFLASCIRFHWQYYPYISFPKLRANLNDITDMPIRFYTSLGGKLGPKATIVYKFYANNGWKNFLRFDYRLNRGPGIGVESRYRSTDGKTTFQGVNYVARDSSFQNPREKTRYRVQGRYLSLFAQDKISLDITYDKLSDQEMPSDYSYSSIDLKYAGITRLQSRWQEKKWISNFFTTVRVNNFQSLKQELPSYEVQWKPFSIGTTGIISDNRFRAGYLDYKYAKEVHDAHDYHSLRIEYFQRAYRRLTFGPLYVTPEASILSIFYENPRLRDKRWLNMGLFSIESSMPLYRQFTAGKHVLTPYLDYRYYTKPTVSPNEHYIFDIEDGWSYLNLMQMGVRNQFYWKGASPCWNKHIAVDFYANGFFDTKTQPVLVPKAYAKATWQMNPYMKTSINTAWDFQFHYLDHINLRADWTLSDDFAISTEYRHRSPTAWRKADPTSFMLESFRTTEALLNSPLSDRRDTLLLRCCYRFSPTWITEFQLRHGWNRKRQPNYTEYECDLIGVIQRAWQLRLSYQRKENDHHRFAIYLNFGLKRPVQSAIEHHIPTLSF